MIAYAHELDSRLSILHHLHKSGGTKWSDHGRSGHIIDYVLQET